MSDIVERPILWCCHVRGPDDVHPAPDYETALAWSDWVNDKFGPQTREDDNYPVVRAAPAIWPWDAERHAAKLPDSIAEFTPRGPIAGPPMLAAELTRLRAERDEARTATSRPSLSDRLTPLLISAGLVKGTTPRWIRRLSGAKIGPSLELVSSKQDGKKTE